MKRRLGKRGRNSVELVKAVSEALDCTYGEANYLVDLVAHVMTKCLRRKERIMIAGIGTLVPWVRRGHLHNGAPWGKGRIPKFTVSDVPDHWSVLLRPHAQVLRALNPKESNDTQEPGPSNETS